MEALLRTQAGCFELKDSMKLGEVEEACAEGNLSRVLLPVDAVFGHLKEVRILKDYQNLVYNGNPFSESQIGQEPDVPEGESRFRQGEQVRVYDRERHFIGIYRYHAGKQVFRVEKMFLDTEAAED